MHKRFYRDCIRKNIIFVDPNQVVKDMTVAQYVEARCRVPKLFGRPLSAMLNLSNDPKSKQCFKDLLKSIGFDHIPTWEEIRDKVESPDADGSNIALIELYRILKPVSPIH